MQQRNREIITLVLVIAVIITAGLNSRVFFKRFDMTEDRVHTISDASRRLFEEIPHDIIITYYISEKLEELSPYPRMVKDLLDEYANLSRGKIDVRIIDPIKSDLEERVKTLGLIPQQVEVVEEQERATTTLYSGVVVEYLDRREVLPFVAGVESLEYELTSAIQDLIYDEEHTLGVLIGDEARDLDRDYTLFDQYVSRNYTIQEIEQGEPIPPSLPVLFVIGQKSISFDDVLMLDEYLMQGGRIAFCVDPVSVDVYGSLEVEPAGDAPLFTWLSHYGLVLKEQLVLDTFNKQFRIPSRSQGGRGWEVVGEYPHWVSILQGNTSRENPITAHFGGLDLLWPSPIVLHRKQGLTYHKLLSSSSQAWLMQSRFITDPYKTDLFTRSREETRGSYALGVIVEGTFPSFFHDSGDDLLRMRNDEYFEQYPAQQEDGKMIVIGDSDWTSDLIHYSNSMYNLLFLENVADWLSEESDLLDIKNRTLRDVRLNKIENEAARKRVYTIIVIINVVIIPLCVALFGLLRYRKRISAGRRS